jgi:phage terminase Nu1 subunit (DNA packaging protein)
VWDAGRLQQNQVASLLGVTSPAVTAWRKRGCPRNEDGSYDLAAVVRWVRAGAFDASRLPQTEVLRIFGVSKPGLLDWHRRGCPRNEDRSYDLAAVVQWRMRELEARAKQARQLSGLDEARRRKTAADAQLAEMTLAQRRGDLLPRTAVVAGWVSRYKAVQSRLMGMLGRLGSRGVTAEHVALVREEILDMLRDLAAGQVCLQLSPAEAETLTELLGLAERPGDPDDAEGGEGGG